MIIVNIIGLILILAIVWWFWIKKPQTLKASSNQIDIIVENGVYTPSRIEIKSGDKVKLTFLRKDPSPCAEKVIFDELDLSLDLPVDKKASLSLQVENAGEYSFTCQMKMYVGTLVVVE